MGEVADKLASRYLELEKVRLRAEKKEQLDTVTMYEARMAEVIECFGVLGVDAKQRKDALMRNRV